MPDQTPTDRIGHDDGTGHGPIVEVPAEQVPAMRSIVDANRRALGLPPQPRRYFALLVCLHCTEDAGGDPLVMPFGGATELAAATEAATWWEGHSDGTGHTWAWWNRRGEEPPPHEAARQSLAYMRETREHAPARAAVSSAVPGEPTEGGADQ